MENDRDITRVIQAAAAYLRGCGAREVYLFGSAREKAIRGDSDIDLAVEGLPPDIFFRAMGALFRILDRPVDLIDLDQDNPFTRALKEQRELIRV